MAEAAAAASAAAAEAAAGAGQRESAAQAVLAGAAATIGSLQAELAEAAATTGSLQAALAAAEAGAAAAGAAAAACTYTPSLGCCSHCLLGSSSLSLTALPQGAPGNVHPQSAGVVVIDRHSIKQARRHPQWVRSFNGSLQPS